MGTTQALGYAQRHELHALLVERSGETVLEAYGPAHGGESPHALYSGSKSFWGIAALAAQADGLLGLDERVAATFPAWEGDAHKRQVTLRMLLMLTSGFGFGGLGNAVPTYAASLEKPVRDEPGSRFTYGGVPLQVFGAVFARKLEPLGLTPHQYLAQRILTPAGVEIARWRELRDGTSPLPTGAFVRPKDWLAYGRLILRRGSAGGRSVIAPEVIAPAFEGSPVNPRYGLGWWLRPSGGTPQTVYASGSGGQALYIVPEREIVAVHFGDSGSWNHDAFLKRLLE